MNTAAPEKGPAMSFGPKVICSLAALCFVAGLLLIFCLPAPEGFRKTLADLGGVVAGAWALSAGLLSVFVALVVAEADRVRRQQEVATSYLAEIKAAWAYLGEQGTIGALELNTGFLEGYSSSIARVLPASDDNKMETYDRHLGARWLSIQAASPEVIGALPLDLAMEVSEYYSRLLNLIDRLNRMAGEIHVWKNSNQVIANQTAAARQLRDLDKQQANLCVKLEHLAGIPGS